MTLLINTKNAIKTINTKEYREFYYKLLQLIEKFGIDINNKTVADFGCGMGTMLSILKEKYSNIKIFGFDITHSAVNLAKKEIPEETFNLFDLYKEPENKYDILICTEVLEHILYPNIALKNLIKQMHEKSVLFLTVPDGRKDHWLGHINFWSQESWKIFIDNSCDEIPNITGRLSETVLYSVIGNQLNNLYESSFYF